MKLFKKPKSKFYWYDFTVRGRRYRASTQETKSVRAQQIASLKLASVMERTDPLPTKPVVLQEFANRFLDMGARAAGDPSSGITAARRTCWTRAITRRSAAW